MTGKTCNSIAEQEAKIEAELLKALDDIEKIGHFTSKEDNSPWAYVMRERLGKELLAYWDPDFERFFLTTLGMQRRLKARNQEPSMVLSFRRNKKSLAGKATGTRG